MTVLEKCCHPILRSPWPSHRKKIGQSWSNTWEEWHRGRFKCKYKYKYLRRVTSWEAPNMATPLREARRGNGIDCKESRIERKSAKVYNFSFLPWGLHSSWWKEGCPRWWRDRGGRRTFYLLHNSQSNQSHIWLSVTVNSVCSWPACCHFPKAKLYLVASLCIMTFC